MPLQMKNPPHPGELIGDTLEEFGVKITEAAKVLGITRQQLHNLIAGRSGVSAGNGSAAGKGARQHRRCLAADANELRLGADQSAREHD